jgi:hypothetical protein
LIGKEVVVRRILSLVAAGGLAVLLTQHSPAQDKSSSALTGKPAIGAKVAEPAEECGSFGTSVTFLDTPSMAAKQALKEEKLVFVLHVSGNFETPEFT